MAEPDQILRNLLCKIANEQNIGAYEIKVKPISSDGANYTSQLFLVDIAGENVIKLFAKVATRGEKMREQTPLRIFDIERLAYTKLMKIYQDIEKSHEIPEEHRLIYPKFYGCNPTYLEECIVLENLVSQGYKGHDRLKSIDWPYAEAAVTELAKFHALSMAYQKELPTHFEATLKELHFNWTLIERQMSAIWDPMLTSAVEATKEENRERLNSFLKTITVQSLINYTVPLQRPVIAHGDFRSSNLMYKVHDDGSVEVKVVDYQTLQAASPVVDFLYFVFTASDEQFRAEYYQKLIDHYYNQLSLALRRLHLNPDDIYSRNDFDMELKMKLPYALCLAVYLLPIITVEADKAPKLDDNLELANLSVQNSGDLYKERLNGVVNDFIKWGVI